MQAQLKRSGEEWLVSLDAHDVGSFRRLTDAISWIESMLYPTKRR